ncbi:MAG: 50S ribosomal protein L11 methyltransferase [Anaerolineae bacterium]|nr:50S ribosomal protein L11 methyltransferase [Anaerolineae bacterium]
MNWIEISVRCDEEGAEAVSELFNRYNSGAEGHGGAVVEIGGFDAVGELRQARITVRTYLPADEEGRARQRRIEEGLWHLRQLYPLPDAQVRELAETDWAEAWKAHYRPLRVGQRLLITPSWLTPEAAADEVVIALDPGMAFGSGLHPSTRFCLMLLEQHLRPGDTVLDLGTGSGILAIAAAKLGAASVLARDIDRLAVQIAQENVERNGVGAIVRVEAGSLPVPGSRLRPFASLRASSEGLRRGVGRGAQPEGFQVSASEPETLEPETWNLIVVNILAEVIVDLLEQGLAARLAPGGRLILSGIIRPRADDVETALRAHGLSVAERLEEGDWLALLAQ